jgi:CheY-like chemotaxis protein
MGIAIPADPSRGAASNRVLGDAARAGRAGPRSILVVEDYVDLADTTVQLLREEGHEVVAAYTGWSALKSIETFSPDVVLLDIDLPGLDGYGVADRLRRSPHTCHAQLVAVTGCPGVTWARLHRHGFTAHVLKPYDLDELLGTIDACLSPGRRTESVDVRVVCRVPRSEPTHLIDQARPAWPATRPWSRLRQRVSGQHRT